MHVAIRSRSKRIMELLLKNPGDARLLYKTNKLGETPYQLDQAHDKSLIAQLQGASELCAAAAPGAQCHS